MPQACVWPPQASEHAGGLTYMMHSHTYKTSCPTSQLRSSLTVPCSHSPSHWVHDVHVAQDHLLQVLPGKATLVGLVVLAEQLLKLLRNKAALSVIHLCSSTAGGTSSTEAVQFSLATLAEQLRKRIPRNKGTLTVIQFCSSAIGGADGGKIQSCTCCKAPEMLCWCTVPAQ